MCIIYLFILLLALNPIDSPAQLTVRSLTLAWRSSSGTLYHKLRFLQRCSDRPTDTENHRPKNTKQDQLKLENNDDSDVLGPMFVDQPVNNELMEVKVGAAEMCLVQLGGNDVLLTLL